jgi:hypothetical protein
VNAITCEGVLTPFRASAPPRLAFTSRPRSTFRLGNFTFSHLYPDKSISGSHSAALFHISRAIGSGTLSRCSNFPGGTRPCGVGAISAPVRYPAALASSPFVSGASPHDVSSFPARVSRIDSSHSYRHDLDVMPWRASSAALSLPSGQSAPFSLLAGRPSRPSHCPCQPQASSYDSVPSLLAHTWCIPR